MDPVSVVGLLGSIESIAEGAFKLVAFINTIREGGKQRLRLFTELNSLWMVLVLLGAHLKSEEEEISEAWVKTIAVLDEDDGILDQIQAAFDNLTSRLQPKTGHRKVLQTLRWPFDKSEVESLVVRLERLKGSLDLAMNSTNAAVICEIQNDTKAMRLNVANDEVKSIIDWISNLSFLKQQVSLPSSYCSQLTTLLRMILSSKPGLALANGSWSETISGYGRRARKQCSGVRASLERVKPSLHPS